ncbi:putative RNA-binding protein Luc7-like 1 [Taenia solium]|eukprot:TsM_000731700 transcript=TsM_000731700 gene=TsM_000731700
MSATDQVRSLLDELMGAARDGGEKRIEFDDPRVCKSFLLDCCPHEILAGTRMDLGECPYSHEVGLKSDYRREAAKRPYYYEIDALRHLESFISESNRRTEHAKAKLKETQEELTEEAAVQVEKINKLSEEIGTTLAKAEQKGHEGHVEESLELMKRVEELNAEKAKHEADLRNAIPVSTYQQQKLRVCDVCSAYLGVHDNDRRLADHFGGKLHLGFITIREKLEALRKYVEENDLVRKQREDASLPRREPRRDSRDRGRERDRSRDWDRDRDRSREHRRRRSRSRSHSRSRRHDRHHRSNGSRRHRDDSRERRHRQKSSRAYDD